MAVDKTGWVVGRVLAAQAAARGQQPFLQFQDGEPQTYAEVDAATNRLAQGLLRQGLPAGERVGVMVPNSLAYCTIWFALSRLGCVQVCINTAYRGIFLRHVLGNSGVRTVLIQADYLPALAELEDELPELRSAFVLGLGAGVAPPSFKRVRLLTYEMLLEAPPAPVEREVSYRDLGAIMYTSGTTGPSKGVLMPHAHLYLFGLGELENLGLCAEDTYYICMPLFHANAMLMQLYGTLIAGARAVIVPGFSASRWAQDMRRYGITITNTLGVMTEYIYRQPARPEDGDNRLRVICAVPTPAELREAFEQRFRTRLIEGYGMTEVNIVLYHPLDVPYRPGSCGKPNARYFEVRVVDPDTDEEVPPGEVGEIVVRPKEPFCFMQGYNAMEDRTVEAWRNFWFHTGDAARRDADGYVYFVDRIKDRIRVGGENVSSYEIEKVLGEHPAVAEAAAIAVKSDVAGGEDEIKACLVLKPGQRLAPQEVLDYCLPRMPYFAVPRYVEFLAALPKTPTEKVRKAALRESGLTPETWDREAAGYQVRRRA
jgi:carnitine-CoA ligase